MNIRFETDTGEVTNRCTFAELAADNPEMSVGELDQMREALETKGVYVQDIGGGAMVLRTEAQPSISMREFFALPPVKAAQDVQKANPYGSAEHHSAFEQIVDLAARYNADSFFPDRAHY